MFGILSGVWLGKIVTGRTESELSPRAVWPSVAQDLAILGYLKLCKGP